MTTMRVDSDDFRSFISWLIKECRIINRWSHISRVYEKPENWLEEYLKFQKETY